MIFGIIAFVLVVTIFFASYVPEYYYVNELVFAIVLINLMVVSLVFSIIGLVKSINFTRISYNASKGIVFLIFSSMALALSAYLFIGFAIGYFSAIRDQLSSLVSLKSII